MAIEYVQFSVAYHIVCNCILGHQTEARNYSFLQFLSTMIKWETIFKLSAKIYRHAVSWGIISIR